MSGSIESRPSGKKIHFFCSSDKVLKKNIRSRPATPGTTWIPTSPPTPHSPSTPDTLKILPWPHREPPKPSYQFPRRAWSSYRWYQGVLANLPGLQSSVNLSSFLMLDERMGRGSRRFRVHLHRSRINLWSGKSKRNKALLVRQNTLELSIMTIH